MVITQEFQVFTHFNNHDFSIRQILNTNSYSKIFNKFAHLVPKVKNSIHLISIILSLHVYIYTYIYHSIQRNYVDTKVI